ncbi:MAG: sugar kinase [Bacteroidetes bacterium]|nr:sugar kinase [Bacteroidota bacterium]
MAVLVVGSIALDYIETPLDKIDNALGGSTTFIAIGASYFGGTVNIVGVVGDDFEDSHIKLLEKYNINLEGLQIVKDEKTFRYGCKYQPDMNVRDSLYTELNVFEKFNPVLPESYKNDSYVVLGNIDPVLQSNVLDQLKSPKFVICDTMNFWISIRKQELLDVIKRVDLLIINDSEAKELSGESNLIKAAEIVQGMGPKHLIIKKGEHGALLFSDGKIFSAPAFPVNNLVDPTGAGDSFAGGLAGYLNKTDDLSYENLKLAVVYGSVIASFCVDKFSTRGIEELNEAAIQKRFNEFKEIARF